MSEKIFLHYTKDELDRNFDQRTWASNALEIIGRFSSRSKSTQERLRRLENVPYGSGPDEVLDVFPAPNSEGHIQIFIHGGAWKNFTKDDYSFPADAFVQAGIHTVIVNFSNLPTVRLPEMVDQVRRSIVWVYKNASSFGGDSEKIYLSAQSSGAHLSAAALEADWSDIGNGVIKAATLVSGPYYLEPVVLSARSSYVELSPDEVIDLSPGLHPHRIICPVILGYADNDTDEFKRQTREFGAVLKPTGMLSDLICFKGVNHFELMERFGDPSHALVQTILKQMSKLNSPS